MVERDEEERPGDDLRSLRILAAAFAGIPLEIAPAATGSRTWTDGRTIFLEAVVDPRDRLRMLAVQASLLASGSLAAEVVDGLRHHRALASRYLAVEGHRALAANRGALPPWMGSMIDRDLAGRVHSPSDSLELARRERALTPVRAFGSIEPSRIARGADMGDPIGAAERRHSAAAVIDDLPELDDDDGEPDLGRLLSSPVGGSGAIGRLLARVLRPARAGDRRGGPGADAPTHQSRTRPGVGHAVLSAAAPGAALEGVEPGEPAAYVYPEWDERQRTYRPDWCHVIEEVGKATGPTTILGDGAALRPALARLGAGLTPCRRRRQGDDLDIDAVVDARVGLLTGAPHTDDVYIENLRRRRDLSVLVLLDVSGSAAEPGLAGRAVHEHQREAAAGLVAALHGLGDRVALHAFSSSGRTAVRVTTVKGFDDPLDLRVGERLSALQPGGYTRLGAAIRHGSSVLETHGGTPRRLLVVLSDGLAYDHGYEGCYGEADARRALLEARRRGIGCLCLSVGADADPGALRRVFGATAHATVPSADSLPMMIAPLCNAALRSAEARRRSFQRTERTRGRLLVEEGAK